mgnify:CR=1 FL=1
MVLGVLALEVGGWARPNLDLPGVLGRLEYARYTRDHSFAPPVYKDVRQLRGLMYARMRGLPGRGTGAAELEQIPPEERERLLADFLASPHGQRWRGDEDAEDVTAIGLAA